jgi:hypothetical protein
MNRTSEVIVPDRGPTAAFHGKKHHVFHRMYEDQMAYRDLVN